MQLLVELNPARIPDDEVGRNAKAEEHGSENRSVPKLQSPSE
jgi:hypothetical protein